jgi:hypothetical protein
VVVPPNYLLLLTTCQEKNQNRRDPPFDILPPIIGTTPITIIMLNRIRASVAGDAPESPRHTQQHAAASHHHSPANPSTPQRAGLFGFLKQPSDLPPPPHNNNSNNNNSSSSTTPMGPAPGGFFGSLMGVGAASPTPPSPMEPDSPRTIRASAAALLKFSTTPPLFNAAGETTLNSPPSASSGNNNSNNNDNDRVTALEEQINKRDQHIMKLEHDLQKMQQQHSQLTKDNTTIRRQQLESTHRHAVAIRLWRRTNDGLAARVDCFEKETTPSAAREIANLIRDAAPPNKDSAYLMMLQDQLAKATTKLDHLSSQTEIVLHKGEEVVESLREEMNEVIRERCRMEIELMDQEYMLGEDMKRLVIRTERRLKRVQGEIDFLEKNAVEALKNQEGDDDEDGSDDEGNENNKNDVEENKSDEENDVEGNKDINEGEGADQEKDDQTDETETEKTSKEDQVDDDDDDDQEKEAEAKTDENANPEDDPRKNEGSNSNGTNDIKKNEEEDQKPEVLRHELRKIAMERDRCLSVLQKKLREKNEEFMTLVKLKESRTKAIEKIEKERRDREEWERSRGEEIIPSR